MKKIILLLFIPILLFSCQRNEEKTLEDKTTIQISERKYSFGKILQTDSVEHSFIIKNIGNNPLIIKSARAACGCTIVKWDEKPVFPNKMTIVKVRYKPNKDFDGVVDKSIVIQANTDSIFHVLYLRGTVEKI